MKPFRNIFLIIVALIDLVIVRSSLFLAIDLRGTQSVHGQYWNERQGFLEFIALLSFSIFISMLFAARGLYRFRTFRSIAVQSSLISEVVIYCVAGLSMLAFFVRMPWVIDSRLAVLYFAAICIALLFGFRLALVFPVYSLLSKKKILSRRIVLFGDGLIARMIIKKCTEKKYHDIVIVGLLVTSKRSPEDTGLSENKQSDTVKPIVVAVPDIPAILSAMNADELIIAANDSENEELMNVIDVCRNTPITVVIASALMEVIYSKISIETYFDIPVVVLPGLPWNPLMVAIKRVIDFTLAIVLIVVTIAPMVVIAALVKMTSRGPAIYRQVRVGKDGKEFVLYKFRTMIDDDHSSIEDSTREIVDTSGIQVGSHKYIPQNLITPIGTFLRRSSLDELPQLFNVVRGEMSLVGPRPAMINEYKLYEQWHKRRCSILPGCTGLWQVTSRGEGDFNHMVLLDLYYINNFSIMVDLNIILKTIPVMIFGKGGR